MGRVSLCGTACDFSDLPPSIDGCRYDARNSIVGPAIRLCSVVLWCNHPDRTKSVSHPVSHNPTLPEPPHAIPCIPSTSPHHDPVIIVAVITSSHTSPPSPHTHTTRSSPNNFTQSHTVSMHIASCTATLRIRVHCPTLPTPALAILYMSACEWQGRTTGEAVWVLWGWGCRGLGWTVEEWMGL